MYDWEYLTPAWRGVMLVPLPLSATSPEVCMAPDPVVVAALERIKRFSKVSEAQRYKVALQGRKVPAAVVEALDQRLGELRKEAAITAARKDQLPLFD